MNNTKSSRNLFIFAAIMLALLPFTASLTDFLTNIVIKFELTQTIRNIIIPYEMNLLATVLNILGFKDIQYGMNTIQILRHGRWETVYLSWNCVGWQSAVLFLLTLSTGISGKHTKISKIEAILAGAAGIFFINLFRLVSVIIIYQTFGRLVGIIWHDYIVTLIMIFYLFIFWYIAYNWILEEKTENSV